MSETDNRATIESVLLTATRVSTYNGEQLLTNASGFFFERARKLYLVTSRHVVHDDPTGHHPDRIAIELHTDTGNMAASIGFSIPLYRYSKAVWRQATDAGGEVDVATLELDRVALPPGMAYRAFTPDHLQQPRGPQPTAGTALLIVCFPLGFHDTLHHLPVVRHAVIASSWGMRFQGKGYFLTDARTHRGTSGAPVLMAAQNQGEQRLDLPWTLLGVHSASFDVGSRDAALDEALGLNCAWYADVLLALTGG
jgi:hypothetical protein